MSTPKNIELLNELIQREAGYEKIKTNDISDGYHTFGELYEHRIELFLALLRALHLEGRNYSVRSKLHHDGSSFDGWFIVMLTWDFNYELPFDSVSDKPNKLQISYHLPMKYWDRTNWITTVDRAPEWDGHKSSDVVDRISRIYNPVTNPNFK